MRKLIRIALALGLGLSVSACASLAPPLPAGTVEVPPSFSLPAAEAAADPATAWGSLGDPVLPVLVERALAANPDLRIASARMAAARAVQGVADSNFLPVGGIVVDQTVSRDASGSRGLRIEEASARFLLSWELDLFGRLRDLGEAADSRLAASEADLEAARLSLAAEVARTYLLLRGAEDSADHLRRFRDAQAQIVRLSEVKVTEGALVPGELARARAELASDEAELLQAEDRAARLQNALAVRLGEVPGRWSVPESAALGPLELRPLRLPDPSAWIAARPDVRAAALALRAENAEIGAARAARLPRLSIAGIIGFWTGQLGDLASVDRPGSSYGAAMQWNVLDLPRLGSEVALARAETTAALALYDRTVLRALEDVENALRSQRSTQERSAARLRQASEARKAADAALARYEEGASDYLDALTARRDSQRADLAATEALVEQRVAVTELLRALARPPHGVSGPSATAGGTAAARLTAPAQHSPG
jgi:multidrug efflux system outer membrane protein